MTSALKEELKKWLNQLATDERKDPTRYHDSGMLFRLPNGLAVEPGHFFSRVGIMVSFVSLIFPDPQTAHPDPDTSLPSGLPRYALLPA